jgi:transcription antitermination protein NusB
MQAIFQLEQNPSSTAGDIAMFVAESLKFPELEQFCKTIIHGTRENQARIDHAIADATINWKVERMAAVDRAILRLSVYEMIISPEPTPPRVVITEAVEIAKRFSTNESARFVNGILDRVARMHDRAGDESPVGPMDSAAEETPGPTSNIPNESDADESGDPSPDPTSNS